jgi:hypothetical protein
VAQRQKPRAGAVVVRDRPGNRAAFSDSDSVQGLGTVPCVQDDTSCYVVRDEALIEDFQNGSLVLLGEQLRFVQMNHVARAVVGLLDGQRTVRDTSAAIAERYDRPFELVIEDVQDLLAYLESRGVVEQSAREGDVIRA